MTLNREYDVGLLAILITVLVGTCLVLFESPSAVTVVIKFYSRLIILVLDQNNLDL